MSVAGRLRIRYIIFIVVIASFAAFSGVQGKVNEENDPLGLVDVDVKACEGMQVTQCELAKNLILTLKMGEDLTCEACFISLRALGIAPGEDWSYDDPHKVVTPEEIKEVISGIHRAYNDGTVRLDGFVAAAGINRFCQDIKGPSAPPSTGTEEMKQEEGGQQQEMPAPPDAQGADTQKGEGK
ncbi:MAG: hypothetical protein A2Y65_12130 [Deltaproteobacteria bacterium RBG_13_52_11]|nr:MAG: hypothetical protein A2Y65_12130 [Deltaproteobacteria bacterium RBG_13_52_11]